ncbi:MAG TPA: hypothetical protein VHA52_02505, partial [Candidatus Babeliaceae bacterium]|nr:hypothetical protein [Candidatus Babeliaceae bacterium]
WGILTDTMNVEIRVMINEVERATNIDCIWGAIKINDFYEAFVIPLEYWGIEDYQKQWKEGLARIKSHDISCLVASVQDPLKAPLINWWILYKIGNEIVIQNQLLVEEYYEQEIGSNSFTPENCYNFISPRVSITEEGDNVSEWIVTL